MTVAEAPQIAAASRSLAEERPRRVEVADPKLAPASVLEVRDPHRLRLYGARGGRYRRDELAPREPTRADREEHQDRRPRQQAQGEQQTRCREALAMAGSRIRRTAADRSRRPAAGFARRHSRGSSEWNGSSAIRRSVRNPAST